MGDFIVTQGEQVRSDELRAILAEDLLTTLNPGQWMMNAISDSIKALGNFLVVIGRFIELMLVPIGGILGGITLMGISSILFASTMRRLTGMTNYAIGAVLGFVGGACLMMIVGTFGLSSALAGLLPPMVAALLGGQILVLLWQRANPASPTVRVVDPGRRAIQLALSIFGMVLAFVFTFNLLNTGRSLIDGTLPPGTTSNFFGVELPVYLFQNMLIGAILGAIAGGLAGVRREFPLGNIFYNLSRTILNTIRSIEPLIMGLVFVIWVGIGPFAGVLALTLHSIAALGKLYSEQIENIDPGPLEALRSTGADRFQTIVYAVIPQIVPPYIAFTMYRWDINVRMSTIIGFVGGGGIGLLLNQWINLLRYRDAGVAVLAIALVVSVLDYTSALIRERLT